MPGSPSGGGAPARSNTTQWSLVLAAGERGSATADEALAALCERYWSPVFAFVRRQGHAHEEAQDLTQGFFARLIEKRDIAAADPARGRFRSFLLTACRHYLANQRQRARAVKRGGGRPPLPLQAAAAEARYQRALSHAETPEHLYDRQWCLTLLDGVLTELRDAYRAAGQEELFARLRPFLVGDEEAGSQAAAALDLGLSAGAARVALHRLRVRYREELRRRVAETVASDAEVEGEIRHLLAVLSASPGGR